MFVTDEQALRFDVRLQRRPGAPSQEERQRYLDTIPDVREKAITDENSSDEGNPRSRSCSVARLSLGNR